MKLITSSSIIKLTESLVGIDTYQVVKELLNLYPTKDFKQAVIELSQKYNISALDLVDMFMDITGTLSTELPDNYTLKSFKSLTKKSSPSQNPQSKGKFFDKNDYGF